MFWHLALKEGETGPPQVLCLKVQYSTVGVNVGPHVKGRGEKLELILKKGGVGSDLAES